MDRRTALRALAAATALPVVTADQLAGLAAARRSLVCAPAGASFVPAALTAHEVELVTAVADLILPRTDTPSASDVGVPAFIDLIVDEWFDSSERVTFVEGLAALDARATEAYGTGFLPCSNSQREELVAALDEELEAQRTNGGSGEEPFFAWMKRLTLTGYFTSEEVMGAMDYRTIPGRFEGCIVGDPA